MAVWCYGSSGGGAGPFSVFLGAVIVVNGGVKHVLTHRSSVGSGGRVVVAENGGGCEKGQWWQKKRWWWWSNVVIVVPVHLVMYFVVYNLYMQ